MEKGLKERLVGAAVLVILAVIFIPMLLDDSEEPDLIITESNIPPRPDNLPVIDERDFNSRIIPLENDTDEQEPAEVAEEADVIDEVLSAESGEEELPSENDLVSEAEDKIIDKPETNVGLTAWVVQLGSFETEANAEALNKKLRETGYTSFVEPVKQKNTTVYRVRVGPELKRSDAQSILEKLEKSMKLDGIVVSYP